jgi:hypothetical protein
VKRRAFITLLGGAGGGVLLSAPPVTVDLHAEHTMPEPVENDSPEMSFRRGYQHGVIDVFSAIERRERF